MAKNKNTIKFSYRLQPNPPAYIKRMVAVGHNNKEIVVYEDI